MKIKSMTSIPAHSNPFHYDHFSQGVDINKRFLAMFYGDEDNELIIVDKYTGERKKLIFPPAGENVSSSCDKEEFVRDLVALLEKYNARIERNTDYDGTDSPCGDTFEVIAEGWTFDLNSVAV